MTLVIEVCPNCGTSGDLVLIDMATCPNCGTYWRPKYPRLVADRRACGCPRDPWVFGHWHAEIE